MSGVPEAERAGGWGRTVTPDVQYLVAALQDALGLKVTCGSITLNLNEATLQSVKTETHMRIKERLDARREKAQTCTSN